MSNTNPSNVTPSNSSGTLDSQEWITEYILQQKTKEIENLALTRYLEIDLRENSYLNNILHITKEKFSLYIKRGVINAFIIYYTEPSDVSLQNKITNSFRNNLEISIKIPQTVNFSDITPDKHEGRIITFPCQVVGMEEKLSRTISGFYVCEDCNHEFVKEGDKNFTKCPECKNSAEFIYANTAEEFQRFKVRELFENTGTFAQKMRDIEVHGDDMKKMEIGQRRMITGVVRSVKMGKIKGYRGTVNRVVIDVIHVEELEEKNDTIPSDTELENYKELIKTNEFIPLLTRSYAWWIAFHDDEKLSAILGLINGTKRYNERGSIHVLFIGEPGTAKTKIAKFALRLLNKSMPAMGTGATKAGLGLGADKTETGRLMLTPGPLVLCSGDGKTGDNSGVVVFDEFGELKPDDMASLREVMEDQHSTKNITGQSVSPSAVVSIIAAMNPKYDAWDDHFSIRDNMKIPLQMTQRFDLKWRSLNVSNVERDEEIADHILDTRNDVPEGLLTPRQLQSYINYVRDKKPPFTDEAGKVLKKFYFSLTKNNEDERKETKTEWRELQSLIRISTAFAKLLLKSSVDEESAEMACDLYKKSLESFGQSAINHELLQTNLGRFEQHEHDFTSVFNQLREEDSTDLVDEDELVKKLLDKKLYKNEEKAKNAIKRKVEIGELIHDGRNNKYLRMVENGS